MIWLAIPYLTIMSSWHGGQIIGGSPKLLKAFLWGLPFGIVAGLAYAPYGWIAILPGIVVTALCALGKNTGHGRGFRLKEPMKEGSELEKVEYLIRGLYGKIPLYWYKVLIMALAGLAAVLGCVLLLAPISVASCLFLIASGAFKGVNAMIFDLDTVKREWADGFTAGCGLVAAFLVM